MSKLPGHEGRAKSKKTDKENAASEQQAPNRPDRKAITPMQLSGCGKRRLASGLTDDISKVVQSENQSQNLNQNLIRSQMTNGRGEGGGRDRHQRQRSRSRSRSRSRGHRDRRSRR